MTPLGPSPSQQDTEVAAEGIGLHHPGETEGFIKPTQSRKLMTTLRQGNQAAKLKLTLIVVLVVTVILGVLGLAGYIIKIFLDSKYFFCSQSVGFVPWAAVCDGSPDCAGREDELTCVSNVTARATFPVRLVSNNSVLQVYSTAFGWSTVCVEGWSPQHTVAACRQLGYTLNECSSGSVVSLSCSDCGNPVGRGRIVGGTEAAIEQWPWQLSLQYAGEHSCGGTLVSPHWVITAAHCFSGSMELSQWRVVGGHTYMGSSGGVSVDSIILNGDYNPANNDYDIAMIRLAAPLTIGATQHPVCLPPHESHLRDGDPLVVTGWGYLEEKGKVSSVLQKATVPLIGREVCTRPAVYGPAITPRMLCAGYLEGQVDACKGDSGGPLVRLSDRWQLVGIVSWGIGCGRKGKPGIYSKVDETLNWIYTVMEYNLQ
ncbi:transmembrane protease serine 4-like [Megalops cyprinoides]|uniref:transmembrane protease serine 4-like n=1 Tax=Megalops cyprinoides TaxID=118141 RepID=UPI0018655696|nr:transmembrane protease serine 4-like [Megalops cyprinoides]